MKFGSSIILSCLVGYTIADFARLQHELEIAIEQKRNSSDSGPSVRGLYIQNFESQLSKLYNYGCWCYFDDDHGKGKSQPVNDFDAICKVLHDGYECIILDSIVAGSSCIPWDETYVSAASTGFTEGNELEDCQTANPGNDCAIRSCAVEKRFISTMISLLFSSAAFDDSKQHSSGFDPELDCTRIPGPASPKECCGDYPMRFPYRTLNGDRQCCNGATFNAAVTSCCSDGTVAISCP